MSEFANEKAATEAKQAHEADEDDAAVAAALAAARGKRAPHDVAVRIGEPDEQPGGEMDKSTTYTGHHDARGPAAAVSRAAGSDAAPHRIVGLDVEDGPSGSDFGSLGEVLDHVAAEAEAGRGAPNLCSCSIVSLRFRSWRSLTVFVRFFLPGFFLALGIA